jgi:hypothetical protein
MKNLTSSVPRVVKGVRAVHEKCWWSFAGRSRLEWASGCTVFYGGNHGDHAVGRYQMPLGSSVLRPSGRCRTWWQHSLPVTVYC